MEKLNEKLMDVLLCTKAMADYADKEERFDELNDVVAELFENDAIDRSEYLCSIMKLTQLGYVSSDIESEEDIEMSEAVGFDISGLTPMGIEYVADLIKDETIGSKVKAFFVKADDFLGKLANSGTAKFASKIAFPVCFMLVR